MSDLKKMDSGKRSSLSRTSTNKRKIKPELPDVPETHAKMFASDSKERKAKKIIRFRKSLGKSLKKWFEAWFQDYQRNEKILRREEHHTGLEVNRLVISFGL